MKELLNSLTGAEVGQKSFPKTSRQKRVPTMFKIDPYLLNRLRRLVSLSQQAQGLTVLSGMNSSNLSSNNNSYNYVGQGRLEPIASGAA